MLGDLTVIHVELWDFLFSNTDMWHNVIVKKTVYNSRKNGVTVAEK